MSQQNVGLDCVSSLYFFFFQAEDGIRDSSVTGVQTCALPIYPARRQGLAYADQVWGIAERRLGGQGWAIGRYSIADIHLFRLYWRFVNSLRPAPETLPNLSAHHDRMMARPAVRRTCDIDRAIGSALPP